MPNGVIISPMKSGKIFYDDKEMHFKDAYRLTIQFGGKIWKFRNQTETELKFDLVEFGYAGTGNMVTQWRKRQSKENQTQAYVAKVFKVTQSAISKMERGKRPIPRHIY